MKTLIYLIIFFLTINFVNALDIKINIQDTFIDGEQIYFNYSLLSNFNGKIIYAPHILCPNTPIAILRQKEVNLSANEIYSDLYSDIKINNFIEPQNCKAYLHILWPFQQTFEKDFEIKTNPSFSFDLNTCKDISCLIKSKVFVLNVPIYIDYKSNIRSPTITTTLINPDQTTKQLTLPTTIKPTQIGTYHLEVTASKESYKTIIKKEMFAVIEKSPEIASDQDCNRDDICNYKETLENCSQDCKVGNDTIIKRKDEKVSFINLLLNRDRDYIVYTALAIFFLMLLIILINKLRNKNINRRK